MKDMIVLSNGELESYMDSAKAAIFKALVREEILDEEIADEWCATHTVILKNKSIFRTLTDRWFKEENEENLQYFLVVKKV